MTDSARTQILVFAAFPAVRAGLVALLAGDAAIEPFAPAADWLQSGGTIDRPPLDRSPPAVVVADLTGIDESALEEIRDTYPEAPQVLIGGNPDLDGPGLTQGAVAYLGSDVDGPTLIAAVRAVMAGLTVIDPVIAGAWARHSASSPLDESNVGMLGDADVLTERERQVLELVATGLPNKAIARELGISEHTVKFHVGSLLGKLGAGSRTEAVTLATRRGLLTI